MVSVSEATSSNSVTQSSMIMSPVAALPDPEEDKTAERISFEDSFPQRPVGNKNENQITYDVIQRLYWFQFSYAYFEPTLSGRLCNLNCMWTNFLNKLIGYEIGYQELEIQKVSRIESL